ncbi:MAG: cytochrome o ubiquinol oxidase subunit IV [Pseudoxanthomonas sp.]
MSDHHSDHAHAGHDDHGHGEGHAPVTLKGYALGFILSVILTAIPFWLVMGNVFANTATTAIVITAFAMVQVVVHMVFFLHLNAKSEGGWNMLATIFTLILLVITISGSLWVMHHLNKNMMPGMTEQDARNLP